MITQISSKSVTEGRSTSGFLEYSNSIICYVTSKWCFYYQPNTSLLCAFNYFSKFDAFK